MKITKNRLKSIIREMHHEKDEWYSDQDETFADYLYRINQEENELEAEELGGSHDDFEEEEVKPLSRREQRLASSPKRSGMGRRHEGAIRITKGQLKTIIEEEKVKIIREMHHQTKGYRHPKTGESLFLMLNDVVNILLDQGMDTLELANELRGLADDVEDSGPMEYSRG
ncbi:MAG: hypothetical protein CBC29_06445 [Methylococcaceae bacterium TMED69]|nr:MAG: hypothetical protein CBC29_06445 [Methylococcaceae bacterium TMED69]|tara:strand:- start:3346 stop:3855 length:510 start_codon:yes stop_codon:yes gene_type:complete